MEKKKNDVTREKLILLLSRYIKSCYKKIDNNHPYIDVGIRYSNWINEAKEWSRTDIRFDGTTYHFYDKEINDAEYLLIIATALKESKCRGNIQTSEWSSYNEWREIPHKSFESLTLIGKPCKEFKLLQNTIKKYSGTEIKELEIFSVDVCGKRSSWNKGNNYTYLDFNKDKCKEIIDFIRNNRTSKDKVTCKVHDWLNHGDEGDYRCAQYQESEWYGSLYEYIDITVNTPTGRQKAHKKFFA